MDDHRRLDELRRRVEKDPASIAFASLAEELRKAGHYDEAVQVCRAGLEHHSTYLSARVTLGRALLALQQYGEARTEIEYVLHAAPDNLLALKCMSELEAHPGDAPSEPAKPNLHVQTAPEPATVQPPAAEAAPTNGGPPPEHPAIGELEDWQARIRADRAQRPR